MANLSREDRAALLRSFLQWLADKHQAGVCVPGYAGGLLESGRDDEFIAEFLAEQD